MEKNNIADTQIHHRTLQAMGTRFDVVVPYVPQKMFEDFLENIKKVLAENEQILSRFISDSPVSIINNHNRTTPIALDERFYAILKDCYQLWEKTNGLFDITVTELMKIWGIWHGQQKKEQAPDKNLIKENLAKTGMDKIIFNDNNKTIQLIYPEIELDFGGYGKGYALEKIKKAAIQHQVENAFISFGESSILAIGHHPYGNNWNVGIQHCLDKTITIHTFQARNQSVSTSGVITTNNYYLPEYSHIVNPKTGYPLPGNLMASVHSHSPLTAEILSTALLIADEKEEKIIFNNFNDIKAIKIKYGENNKYEKKMMP